jgi:hypothetical protein
MKRITTAVSVILASTSTLFSQLPFAGNGTVGYSGDGGPATNASLNIISYLTTDATGNFYISDLGNYDVRKVNAPGIISTYAGNQTGGFSGDGAAATSAQLQYNRIVKTDLAGNLYILDQSGARIRKVSPAGMITTIAGTGSNGFSGDGGPATSADINATDMVLDAAGNIYIVYNTVVRKINTAGIITTIAGTGVYGYSGDGGPATAAMLGDAYSLGIDNAGNLYVTNEGAGRIRKISTSGIISTYAGTGTPGYSGDGGNATMANIRFNSGMISLSGGRISFNSANELCFIAFSSLGSVNIRKISSTGVISTVLDSTYFTNTGGELAYIHIDSGNNLYFTSARNFCGIDYIPGSPIYKISLNSESTGIEAMDFNNTLAKVYPVPNHGIFTIETALTEQASYDILDIKGQLVYSNVLNDPKTKADLSHLAAGTYIMNIKGNGVTVKKTLLIN